MKPYFAALFISALFMGPLVALAAGPAGVNLGSAGSYVILAKTGISTTGSTAIVGDLGLSPAAATYITGFALTLPTAGAFSTSAIVTGKIYAADYADPTPAKLTTTVLDMQTAYTNAMGRAPDVTELGAGNIGGLTLTQGVYKWGTGLLIPVDVTLSGSANDVWIFQIAQTLNVSSAVKIVLAGGAQASNVYWIVGGQTTIGTTAVMNGNILDQTAIVMNTGAQLNGRALAQTAVTLDANNVTAPSSSSGTPALASPVASPPPSVLANTPAPTNPPVAQSAPVMTPTSGGQSETSSQTGSTYSRSAYFDGQAVDISAQIRAGLQDQLNKLRLVALALMAQQPSSQALSIKTIAVNLGKGSRDNNVRIVQQFLIAQNKGAAALALAQVGATSYFGELTIAALAEFQASVGISPALGYFGQKTRAYFLANN